MGFLQREADASENRPNRTLSWERNAAEKTAGPLRLLRPQETARVINQRQSRMHRPTVTSGTFRLSRSDFVQRSFFGVSAKRYEISGTGPRAFDDECEVAASTDPTHQIRVLPHLNGL